MKNYITTNHRGGLGNVMFKLAASISLALDNNIDYIFSNEFIRSQDISMVTKGHPDYRVYYNNVLRNIKFINSLPFHFFVYTEPEFSFNEINYTKGTNLLLDGFFQSEKYFFNNRDFITNLFLPTEEIKNNILEKFPNISNCTSIHVRRGDYLNYPNHHPQQSTDYYKKACEMIGINNSYIIFSDDLNGINNMFDFIPNKTFYTSGEDWLDMYTMSLCENNIICNSTFSWWGAYLNGNKNKKVITTNNWFGPVYKNHNIKDLFPESWIKI